MWKCKSPIHPQIFNPRLAGPGMMSTWSVLTPLNRGLHPRLQLGRTRCWMKEQIPGPLELVGQVLLKTLTIQKTIKPPGPYSPEKNPCVSLKTDYFPGVLDWRLRFQRRGIKKISILIRFAFGADTFWASRTGPLYLNFRFWHTRLRPGI